ncbi:hypothetical protein [Carnimonas bestiolae]|uniref:hypothetical protein n=1 Tax=Carnimonas bestiolae TaxID=3402172 RepID=UPI003EDCAFCE
MSNAHDRQYAAEELEAMRKGIMLTPEEQDALRTKVKRALDSMKGKPEGPLVAHFREQERAKEKQRQ